MLTICIDLDYDVVSMLTGVGQSGTDGGSNSEVERVPKNRRAHGLRHLTGCVTRTVVNHEHITADRRTHLGDNRTDRLRLVESRKNR
jgi:hypothetical protein